MLKRKFAVFILTNGRPNKVLTLRTIRLSGYTGRVVLVLDDEDPTVDEYRENYPDEQIVVFNKRDVWKSIDNYTNRDDRRSITYARNASFGIAKDLGLTHFLQLDDDYTSFAHRNNLNEQFCCVPVKDLDSVFDAMLDFLDEAPFITVALSQGGDWQGGGNSNHTKKAYRKAMNSFFCRTDRCFEFSGLINEDVSTYVGLGRIGKLFLTVSAVSLHQLQTQSNEGGITDLYSDFGGGYSKSFLTVMANPASVRIGLLGHNKPRIHHIISWKNAVPLIVSIDQKK